MNPHSICVRSMMHHLVEEILLPRIFNDDVGSGLGYSGSVEVEGKLYALYFRRLNNNTAEVSVTRNSNVVKWTITRDLFNKLSIDVVHHPLPGACGHAAYLNDPWLIMRIYALYVDLNPLPHY